MSVKKWGSFSSLLLYWRMQCNSTRFTTGSLLNFLVFLKNYPACRPATCKKFKQTQLGYVDDLNKIYNFPFFRQGPPILERSNHHSVVKRFPMSVKKKTIKFVSAIPRGGAE